MTPQELALDIEEELAEALADLELSRHVSVVAIVPPDRVDADSSLYVTLADENGKTAKIALSSSLAVAYLADEEAAVDEWRLWVQDIAARFAG
jgi:hypothetical protein